MRSSITVQISELSIKLHPNKYTIAEKYKGTKWKPNPRTKSIRDHNKNDHPNVETENNDVSSLQKIQIEHKPHKQKEKSSYHKSIISIITHVFLEFVLDPIPQLGYPIHREIYHKSAIINRINAPHLR